MLTPSVSEAIPKPNPELDRILMELAHILSHRLRSLVAGIEGFADLLTDTLATKEQRELTLRIIEGTARMERVLADLQLFCNPQVPVPIPLRLSDVLDDLDAALDDCDRERVLLDLEVNEDCTVLADPRLLRQALLVLVQNALDASSNGNSVRFGVKIDEYSGTVRFDVRNSGVISLENPESQVFLPFFTTKAQNLGIGLPIALRIVHAHGGKLYLSSNDEISGTCFTIELPWQRTSSDFG
jgi:two-component system sensor histidine kinase HydH